MHAFALLWFSFLHALLPVVAINAGTGASVVANARPASYASETRPDWATASAPPARHALRAPARTAAALVTQSFGAVTPDRSDAPPLERAAFQNARTHRGHDSDIARTRQHRVASRGGLLPYYPTAPPHRA